MEPVIVSRGPEALQARYRHQVRDVLRGVRSTEAGQIVLRYLGRTPRRVLIVPTSDIAIGTSVAATQAYAPLNAGTFGAGAPGPGSGAEVNFSIERLGPRLRTQAHEVLLHELSHALRQTRGLGRFRRLPNGDIELLRMAIFDTVEEFFVDMVGIVHCSELGLEPMNPSARALYRNMSILGQRPASTRLAEIRRRMRQFCEDMAAIPATTVPRNPFRWGL